MTTTTYLELDDQATGANNNTWGDVADANMTYLELAIARLLSVATTGGSTTLTSAQNRYPIIAITGVLVSNATIVVRTAEKNWIFLNQTTGDYTVTVKTTAGTGKTIPRQKAVKLYCDGTNVEYARAPGIPHAAAGGTVDAITATFYPATVAADLEDGYTWIVEAAGANTVTTPTFNPDGTGALTIKKNGAQALAVGDIRAAGHKLVLVYDKSGGHVELINPAIVAATATIAGPVELATNAEALAMTDATRALTPANLAAIIGKGADVAGAGTITLGDGGLFNITGTGWTCADIDFTVATDGRPAVLRIEGSGTFTHNGTSMFINGGASIDVVANDVVQVWQDDGNNVFLLVHKADGQSNAVTGVWVENEKAADESIASDALLSMDADIRFFANANNIVAFEAVVFFSSATAADFKFGWDGPASPTLFSARVAYMGPDSGTSFGPGQDTQGKWTAYETVGESINSSVFTAGGSIHIKGILHNGANASSCGFTWAQGTSNVGATTVHAGSWIKYKKIN